MEEINKNAHLLKTLITALSQMNGDDKVRKFVREIDCSNYPSTGPYAQCIYDLKQIVNIDFGEESILERANKICNYYLEYAQNNDPIKKHTDSRKEKYKQLNLDIEKGKMEKFDYYLKRNKHTKKTIIEEAIDNYIAKNEKNS